MRDRINDLYDEVMNRNPKKVTMELNNLDVLNEKPTAKPDSLLGEELAKNFMRSENQEKDLRQFAEKKGLRFNNGKRKWSLVHYKSMEPMIQVLEFGATKYAPFNWQKGLNKSEILESMQRHLAKLFDGETVDAESGISHMGHIQCNAMFYNYMVDQEQDAQQSMAAFLGQEDSGYPDLPNI